MNKKEFFGLMAALEAAGFEQTYSVMDDSGTGGIFFQHRSGARVVIRRMQLFVLGSRAARAARQYRTISAQDEYDRALEPALPEHEHGGFPCSEENEEDAPLVIL